MKSKTLQKNNLKIPRLRFGGFEGEWEEKKLGEVGKNIIGLTYSPKNVVKEGGTIVLRSSNIKKGSLKLDDLVLVNSKIPKKLNIKNNDILICTRNGSQRLIGKNIILRKKDEKMTFGAFMSVYRSEYNEFFNHLFKTDNWYRQIQRNLGARINQITTGYLNQFKFFIPQKQEQQKIAGFLGEVDEWLENLKGQKEKLEDYKKGMMQKIFPSKGGQEPEIRFKDKNGENFDVWKEKRLGEIAEFWNGKAHERDTSENGKYIIVNSKFISQNGKVKKYSDNQISPLKKDDITIVMSDIPNGKAISKCFLIDQNNKYTLNQRIGGIKSEGIVSQFLILVLNRNKYFLKFDNGVSQTNLRKDEILNCPIIFPALPEQQKIANFLTSLNKGIELKQQQIARVEEWKKGLMQGLFV